MSMTPQQLQHFKQRLNDERTRLVRALHEIADTEASADSQELAGDLSKFPTHPADLGTDTIDEELDASITTRVSAEIAEVDAALDRLATSPDTFGLDEETGLPISLERLELIPYARIAVHG